MKPDKAPISDPQMDLFKIELKNMINKNHSLVRLSKTVNWQNLDREFGAAFCQNNGRPGLPTRLMVALHYLKFTHNLSDEAVVKGWVENPYWQYFSGMKYFEHELPCDSSSMTNWRKKIKASGAEKLLEETINAGLKLKIVKKTQLRNINVDTTVQEKDVRFPTDARLYDRARESLVKAAKAKSINLRQNYNRLSKQDLLRQSRYAHAKQMKRARKATRRLKTYLGRVIRDIRRKYQNPDKQMIQLLNTATLIWKQKRKDKNKIYSVHEPHVECISKGKAHKRYEFGCKVSVATTSRGGWFVGAQAIHGNPYDGHTLSQTLTQVERIAGKPDRAFVDRGYRGHGYNGDIEVHVDKVRRGRTSKSLWRWMKRRAAVEPSIGHLKQEHRMDRNRLKGKEGDRINAILSAAGMNISKLLKWLADYFLFLFRLRIAVGMLPPSTALSKI